MLLSGPAAVIGFAALRAIMQSTVPPEMQGRVFSLRISMFNAMAPLGLAVLGPLADATGIRPIYLMDGAACLLVALARLANGVQLALTFADAIPGPDQARLSLIGDVGMMTYDHSDGEIRVHLGAQVETITPEYDDTSPVDSFVRCILDGAPNLSPGEEAANAVYLTEAAYQSAQTHSICKTRSESLTETWVSSL
jgi:hypothetical protein